ncbi:uncharacterized protein MYCGRDRAFT_67504 [Zymoseptoria tritici IPO323]|uniref:Uncharacterized protein n=1 Tax=Zymoseptoria tritici (strain CBS 115943 / IPO323) TaxID=336722 RepID=F9X1J0_ZYMTI|nr:uncharacterized protein MYCGRDRAFT_67504 [Zymoseptoria tritici IPO323]EGP91750.1 hypothetical protein MYCGRDRAFT_67504 [Zymoseptoria tritici IPO323]
MASLRLAVPRAGLSLHAKQLQQTRWFLPVLARRHASTSEKPTPPKPRVLEKPDKFRPPSHSSRLRSKPRYNYGPDLTQEQKTVRRYPHMMPPEGTTMHWFLTNRTIHAWISLSILVSLVISIWISDFLHTTPYSDLLPPKSMFLSHPFSYLGRYIEVYQMHVEYVSAQTAERRKNKVDDVQKRSDYRKAHGIAQGEGIFGGWSAKSDEEKVGPALATDGAVPGVDDASPRAVAAAREAQAEAENNTGKEGEEVFVDFEGKKQAAPKKWFGIW